jgi:aryl-alcohol dehydrogenase-like predicted oxidoreductase
VRTRPLGKTGIDVSELALGTWGLSGDGYGPVIEAEADRVIDRAVAVGITLFDTADAYGRGEMERRLGKALDPSKTLVVTKIGTDLEECRKRFDASYLWTSFEKSQERLKREKLDVVLLHNPSAEGVAKSEGTRFLADLKKRELIKAWGVSAGSTEVARAAIAAGAEVVELAYNVFVAKDLHDLAAEIAEKGTGILARSVLAHGLLAGQWSADREFYPGDHRLERWGPDELKRRISQLDALRPLVAGAIFSIRAVALRFVLANQLVSSAVLGPRSVAQLDQLTREAGTAPPYLRDTALAELSNRLKSAGIPLG